MINRPAATGLPPVPIIEGISPLGAEAEAWICDIWGVVHNGIAAFPQAVEACCRFRAQGGSVLLLTNAPRPAAAVEAQLEQLGVTRTAFDAVLTSGDLTRREIIIRGGLPLAHLGPQRDRGLFDDLEVELAALSEAGAIICSGLYDDDRETAEDYRERLADPVRRGVTMICANPDITVARGDRVIECAGAIARLYQSLGGTVIYAGKPYAPVYERAFEMIAAIRGGPLERSRVLAIGDGVRTDIKGAVDFGLKSVFVASPIHVREPLSGTVLDSLFPSADSRPDAAMQVLAW